MIDLQGRNIEYVRVSITDRCNFRCVYCMPEEGVSCMSHKELLTFEEIVRVLKIMAQMGVHAVRLTGGEPMVRKGCLDLIGMIHEIEGIDRISITTNGMLLKGHMAEAKALGLNAVNISLDTLDADDFRAVTRCGDGQVTDVTDAIDEALACGLQVKINAVPVRGVNEDALCDLASLAKRHPVDVRFIELMPIGCAKGLSPIPNHEIIEQLTGRFGTLQEDSSKHGYGPARYMKPDGFAGSIGFIDAVSHQFCHNCNRVRITPEGILKLCLNHQSGSDLRALLRGGCSDSELTEAIRDAILHKPVEHGFTDVVADREVRNMNQIGG